MRLSEVLAASRHLWLWLLETSEPGQLGSTCLRGCGREKAVEIWDAGHEFSIPAGVSYLLQLVSRSAMSHRRPSISTKLSVATTAHGSATETEACELPLPRFDQYASHISFLRRVGAQHAVRRVSADLHIDASGRDLIPDARFGRLLKRIFIGTCNSAMPPGPQMQIKHIVCDVQYAMQSPAEARYPNTPNDVVLPGTRPQARVSCLSADLFCQIVKLRATTISTQLTIARRLSKHPGWRHERGHTHSLLLIARSVHFTRMYSALLLCTEATCSMKRQWNGLHHCLCAEASMEGFFTSSDCSRTGQLPLE